MAHWLYVILLLFFRYEKGVLQIFFRPRCPKQLSLLAGRWNKPG